MKMVFLTKKNRDLKKAQRLTAKGLHQEALACLEMHDPAKHLDVLIQKAWILGELLQTAQAHELVALGLQTHPQHAVLHMIQGELFFEEKDLTKAEAALKTSLTLSPDNLNVEYMLGQIYAARGQLDQAARLFEKIIRFDPHFAQSRILAFSECMMFHRKDPA